MFGWPFFVSVEGIVKSVIDRIDQWLGNLFYRGQPIDVLEKMTYSRLKYWNSWHELIAEQERKA